MESAYFLSSAASRTGAVAGCLAVCCYFGAALLPLPDALSTPLALAFGPLLMVAFMGLYDFLRAQEPAPTLRIAYLFGLVAGVLVTAFLAIQIANGIWYKQALAAAATAETKAAARLVYLGIDRLQLALDVVFDVFITAAVMLMGWAMFRHARFGRALGVLGLGSGALLLGLNLATFPMPPATSGLFDAGPLVALWLLLIFARLSWLVFSRKGRQLAFR